MTLKIAIGIGLLIGPPWACVVAILYIGLKGILFNE
jgi:hypothetical protein